MKALLVAVLMTTLLACGEGAPPEPPEPAPAPPPAEKPAPPPPAPPKPEVPTGDLRGDPKLGATTYQQFCATCHGAGGKGDGPAAPRDPKPADHTDAVYMGALSDQDLYIVIGRGGASVGKSALMAPWGGVLNEDQLKDVIAYVRSLSGT